MKKNIKQYLMVTVALACTTGSLAGMAFALTDSSTTITATPSDETTVQDATTTSEETVVEDAITTAASTSEATSSSSSSSKKGKGGGRGLNFDTASLVTAGIIDQATADKLTAYQETQKAAMEAERTKMEAMTDTERQAYMEAKKSETKTDVYADLVSQGILTQTQADAVKAATPDKGGKGGGGGMHLDTASLVTAGIIDQATADKLTAYQETQKAAMEAERTKMEAMTDTERQAYMEAKKSETKTDMYADLVSQGILTQTQADAIKAATPDKGGKGGRNFDTASLVTAGIIDQATADKITAYQETQKAAREAERAKLEAMTDTERQAYIEANKSETKTDIYTELVAQGIITQAQADAIKAAQPARPDKSATSTDSTTSSTTATTVTGSTATA